VDGTIVDASLAFSSASPYQPEAYVTYNWTAPTTTGSHLVIVTYPGDATHSASTSTYSVVIGNVLASGGLSLTAGNLTIANGGTGSTQVTVTPTAGYNGRVVWSLAATGNSSNLSACYTIASLPVSNASTTKLTIGIGTACNSALPAERGDFRPLVQRTSANDGPKTHQRSTPATAIYASLLICGLLAGGRRRIRLPLLVAITFLTVASVGLIGCGGGGNSTGATGTTSTTPSTTTSYTVTLTAKDSVNTSISASTTFTLTVN
jgi:hypothetical protein